MILEDVKNSIIKSDSSKSDEIKLKEKIEIEKRVDAHKTKIKSVSTDLKIILANAGLSEQQVNRIIDNMDESTVKVEIEIESQEVEIKIKLERDGVSKVEIERQVKESEDMVETKIHTEIESDDDSEFKVMDGNISTKSESRSNHGSGSSGSDSSDD